MIEHWDIESKTEMVPGTLSAYHLCKEKVTEIWLREWIWGWNDFHSVLHREGLDPIQHGYRGWAKIDTYDQIVEIEQYVGLVNGKRIRTTGTLSLGSGYQWREFRQHLKSALENKSNSPYHLVLR